MDLLLNSFLFSRSLCDESGNGWHFAGRMGTVAGVKRCLDIGAGSGLLALCWRSEPMTA